MTHAGRVSETAPPDKDGPSAASTPPGPQPGEPEDRGTPVGRRVILGLAGLGVAGVLGGRGLQTFVERRIAPLEMHDPTGLLALLPAGATFRLYSVTGSVPRVAPAEYRLSVGGLVARPATLSFADLSALPQTRLVRDFHCVTGWQVLDVTWTGVRLSSLLDRVGVAASATSVRFRSFDGTYTESMTLEQARREDVIVALSLGGTPVSHDHGGPVRMYSASMYGYKSTKWLSAIEVTSQLTPGYWETRGYAQDGWIGG